MLSCIFSGTDARFKDIFDPMNSSNLPNIKKVFLQYKLLAENAIAQMPDEKLFWQKNLDSNSVAIIVKHMSGNMISRWTDFLTTDGEKENRNRDGEFVNDIKTRAALMECWNKGWTCFLNTLDSIGPADLEKIVRIRGDELTVQDAITRQLAHYSYHIGQLVFIAKMSVEDWESLSIPRKKE